MLGVSINIAPRNEVNQNSCWKILTFLMLFASRSAISVARRQISSALRASPETAATFLAAN